MRFLDWLYFGLLALLALTGGLVTALQSPTSALAARRAGASGRAALGAALFG